VLPHSPILRQLIPSLVVDVNDPFHLEQLASGRADRERRTFADWTTVLASLNEQLRIGDFFLAASERQRDHWIGALSVLNRVNPETFQQDPSLRSLIDVVGFGLPEEPPRRVAPAIRGVIPGIEPNDFVLLWNSGIWNWFDPVTLIEAVGLVAPHRPALRLVFMTMTHPNPAVPSQVTAFRARERARALRLVGRHVFFNENWVPYDRRADWLLDADVCVSTHPDHVETRYSYRTRLLDCFWAGLPVICSAGDSVGDLIEREGAGLTVPPGNVPALAAVIDDLATDPDRRLRLAERSRALGVSLTWNRVAEPLVRFCNAPYRATDLAGLSAAEAVPVPLVDDEERARRMDTPSERSRRGGGVIESNIRRGNDRDRLVAERDAAIELATVLQNMKVFRYTRWPRAAYGALLRLRRRD
jgi:glycosyltransferase involved in cell wall biosynthesis